MTRARLPLTLLALCGLWSACDRAASEPSLSFGTPPTRIVAGSVASAEILLAVMPRERIAAVHRLAADGRFSAAAEAAAGLPTVGADPEQLLSCRPDLVIIDPFTRPEARALLRYAGIAVWCPEESVTVDAILANIREYGRLLACSPAAEALAAAGRQRIAVMRAAAADCAGWRIMSLDGALNTYGRGSLFDSLVEVVGARNLAAEHRVGPFRKLDIEAVLAWRPDALVIGVMPGEEAGELERLRQTPGLRLLSCVERGRVVMLRIAEMGSTSHHLLAAAEHLQKQLLAWGRP